MKRVDRSIGTSAILAAVVTTFAFSTPTYAQGLSGRTPTGWVTRPGNSAPTGWVARPTPSNQATPPTQPTYNQPTYTRPTAPSAPSIMGPSWPSAAPSFSRPDGSNPAQPNFTPSGTNVSGSALISPQNNGIPIGGTPTPGGALGNLGPGWVRPAMPRSFPDGNVRPTLPQNLPGNYGGGGSYPRGSQQHYYHRPSGSTVVVGATTFTYFDRGSVIYVPAQGYLSPFGIYSCPPYIGSSYVVTTPYAYVNGTELGAIQPYTDSDSYYASNVDRGRTLRTALNDLSRSWEENDTRALRRHVSNDLAVAVFQDEQYAYSLRLGEFLSLFGDAIDTVSTVSFRFTSVRNRSDGLVNAYATHVFRVRGESETRTAQARYTLIYSDNDWVVSAVSLAAGLAR